jgi:hypothetical protein
MLKLILCLSLFIQAQATEPLISIYQASSPSSSVLVLEWPDGSIDKLVVKNTELWYTKAWVLERTEAYEQRHKEAK